MRAALPVVTGVFLVVLGLAIAWVPGPGGFIGIVGIALLATEFQPLARLLDGVELGLCAVWGAVWKRRSVPARALVVVGAACVAVSMLYFAARLLLD